MFIKAAGLLYKLFGYIDMVLKEIARVASVLVTKIFNILPQEIPWKASLEFSPKRQISSVIDSEAGNCDPYYFRSLSYKVAYWSRKCQ